MTVAFLNFSDCDYQCEKSYSFNITRWLVSKFYLGLKRRFNVDCLFLYNFRLISLSQHNMIQVSYQHLYCTCIFSQCLRWYMVRCILH